MPQPPRVIVYTASNSTIELITFLLARVDGYVHKSTPIEQLVEDIYSASSGRFVWRLGLSFEEGQRKLMVASKIERLSRTEKEILKLILKTYDQKQMALILHISIHTVKKHVGSILTKLEYRSRKELLHD